MRSMFDFLNGPYVVPRCTYDPNIIKSGKMIHIYNKHLHVEFHRGNTIFMPNLIAKHVFLMGPIKDLGVIRDRP